MAALVAVWIIATYLFRLSTYFPYLALTSAAKRAGKSLLLEIVSELAFNATPPGTMPTPATLYRDIDVNGSTIVLDEIEGLGGDKEQRAALLAVLNVGFKYNGTVARMEGSGTKYRMKRYRAFSPKAFAGVRELPDTVRDRALQIRLQRQRKDEAVKRFDARALAKNLADLRDRLHLFALVIAAHYQHAETFPIPPSVDNRARDILEPLFAVAAELGAGATSVLTAAAGELSGARGDDEGEHTVRAAIEVLRDLFRNGGADRQVLRAGDADVIGLFAPAGLSWVTEAKHVRGLLRRLGFTSTSHRVGGGFVRGYEVTRVAVEDLAARYLPAEEPEQTGVV